MNIPQTKGQQIYSREDHLRHSILDGNSKTKYKKKGTHLVQVTFPVEGLLVELADSPKRVSHE